VTNRNARLGGLQRVSLGILSTAPQVASMVGAVLLVTVLGWGLNLLLGTKPSTRPE
jgi:hypothetical protein